jgi:hypothetical protein
MMFAVVIFSGKIRKRSTASFAFVSTKSVISPAPFLLLLDSAKKASRRESTWKNLAVVARRQHFKSVKLKRKTDSINVVSKTLLWEWPAWQRESRP